jgi:glycosyltransferase involved in cell wall biosynthesis
MANGEYVAYLDADDVMLPTKLEVQATYLDEHLEVDVVYSDMYQVTPGQGAVLIKYQRLDPFRLLQRCCVSRITVMHRRVCLEKTGLFNEQLTGSDDWDMWVRMSEVCRMAHIDQALSEYRIHGCNTSLTRPKRLDHYRWSRVMILRNAYVRRGRPLWLGVMLLSARVMWLIGKVPFLGKGFPCMWSLAERIQGFFELVLVRVITSYWPPMRSERCPGRERGAWNPNDFQSKVSPANPIPESGARSVNEE